MPSCIEIKTAVISLRGAGVDLCRKLRIDKALVYYFTQASTVVSCWYAKPILLPLFIF